MITLAAISVVYTVGFMVAWYIEDRLNSRFGTKEDPLFAALFSWLYVAAVLAFILIIKIFKKK